MITLTSMWQNWNSELHLRPIPASSGHWRAEQPHTTTTLSKEGIFTFRERSKLHFLCSYCPPCCLGKKDVMAELKFNLPSFLLLFSHFSLPGLQVSLNIKAE